MSDVENTAPSEATFPNRTLYIFALIFVFMGIVNSMPFVPGWTEMWREISGIKNLRVRSFATEWFYPLVFLIMMTIVALKHSMWRAWQGTSRVAFGLFMDIALVVSAALISVTYLVEIDSVCLIDLLNGDRARLIAETLKAEIAFA